MKQNKNWKRDTSVQVFYFSLSWSVTLHLCVPLGLVHAENNAVVILLF